MNELALFAGAGGGESLVGINADEAHRMPSKIRPLVDLDIGRDEVGQIIRGAGLPLPVKSGCWCCPFMRVSEIITLAKTEPCKMKRIKVLEETANETHGPARYALDDGTFDEKPRTHWGDKPVEYWEERAKQGDIFIEDTDPSLPCICEAS